MGFRANYLQGVGRAVARGDLDLAALRKESYEGAVDVLTAIPGVGRKVADCVLLFAYDFPQAFPIDVWVRRGLRRLYAKRRLSDEKLRQWAVRRWNGWAGYAQQYLFHAERENASTNRSNRGDTPVARVR
jgi:N-glycosylase/DNA lyase